jgi:hypothetical protein
MQSLIDADLIGAESSAALKDKNYLTVFILAKVIHRVFDRCIAHVHLRYLPRFNAFSGPLSASSSAALMRGPSAVGRQSSASD